MMEVLFAIVSSLGMAFALDNLRLRRKLKKKDEPVHVLKDGLIMPVPDDPRWAPATLDYVDEEYDERRDKFKKVRRTGRGYRLGEIFVDAEDNDVWVADHQLDRDKRSKAYARAVCMAWAQQRALKAMEE